MDRFLPSQHLVRHWFIGQQAVRHRFRVSLLRGLQPSTVLRVAHRRLRQSSRLARRLFIEPQVERRVFRQSLRLVRQRYTGLRVARRALRPSLRPVRRASSRLLPAMVRSLLLLRLALVWFIGRQADRRALRQLRPLVRLPCIDQPADRVRYRP